MTTPLYRYDEESSSGTASSDPDIQAEHDEACNQNFSSTGMCPCCGAELIVEEWERWTGKFNNVLIVEAVQGCPSCGWESDLLYDG